MNKERLSFFLLIWLLAQGCSNTQTSQQIKYSYPTTGRIERLDPALDAIVDTNAKAEIIAEGFNWVEGPLWVEREQMLLFSDIPANKVYKWTEENGTEVYLDPAGYTGTTPSNRKEPGSNGLLLNSDGNLVLCQHGDRRIASMDAPLHDPQPKFVSLVDHYQGKCFNSPNDAVFNKDGVLFFTDPPMDYPRKTTTIRPKKSRSTVCTN